MGTAQQRLLAIGTPSTETPQIFVDSTDAASAINLSWSHTVGAQANGILLVWIYYWNAARTISGITFNGVALTKIATQINGGAAERTQELWYLLSPATGTHTIAATGTGTAADKSAIAVSLYNALQSPPDTPVTSSGNGTTASLTLTGTTTDLFLDGLGHNNTGYTTTPDAGQTQIVGVAQGNQGNATSYIAGSASRVMGWTLQSSNNWSQIGVKIAVA